MELSELQNCDRSQQSRLYTMSHILYAIHHREFVPRSFNSFWTTLPEYVLTSPSDGTVLCTLRLEIYGATSVFKIFLRLIQTFLKFLQHFRNILKTFLKFPENSDNIF